MSTGLMLFLFAQRLQPNDPIQTHSLSGDNSDSAKTRFCKSIKALPVKHDPIKILFAMNLSHQEISLSNKTFGKLQFVLKMFLNRQIKAWTSTKHHPPSSTSVAKPEPGITISLNHYLKFYMNSCNDTTQKFISPCLSFSSLKFRPIIFSSWFHIKSLDQCWTFGKKQHNLLNWMFYWLQRFAGYWSFKQH